MTLHKNVAELQKTIIDLNLEVLQLKSQIQSPNIYANNQAQDQEMHKLTQPSYPRSETLGT